MTSILCLAHYCDTHGPTPLMVTEGMPVSCQICYEEDDAPHTERPATGCRSFDRSLDSIPNMSPKSPIDLDTDSPKAMQYRSVSASSSVIDTPPESPRLAGIQTSRPGKAPRRDSSFRKTYDENDKKRLVPCENCALTLPKKVKSPNPETSPRSPSRDPRSNPGPVLRTRKPYERLSTAAGDASPKSLASDSDEPDKHPIQHTRRRSAVLQRSTTSSSMSSFSSASSSAHVHYLDYTSTHDPLSSNSFSILRASCLRTLSCETLPPSNVSQSVTPQTSPYLQQRVFPSNPAIAASASGGPIFFGDPTAGYTTAYIFRIPDPYARGRRRVYAFIFLSSARERAAMRAFSFLSAAFRDLAAWIQSLAEQEADRIDGELASPITPGTVSSSLSHPLREPLSSNSGNQDTRESSDKGKEKEKSVTSAFLAGRLCDPDVFPRKGGAGIRSRGLAELVGRPDFFIELHARFVTLLAQLTALAIS